MRRSAFIYSLLASFLTGGLVTPARAVTPIAGFQPLVGIGLTDEFDDDFNPYPIPTTQPGGTALGAGGTPFYDVALLDTGAAVSLITSATADKFALSASIPGESDGFSGTETITLGGATGFLEAEINDPLGLYATGLQHRSSGGPTLGMNVNDLQGQTNSSIITVPPESDLPNVLGLPFAGQYATYIRNDLPQIFELEGKTVRTPSVEFLPLGSGADQGITRRAPLQLNPGDSFASPPIYFLNIENFDINKPYENPSLPTAIQGGTFLNITAQNDGNLLGNTEFFFDTGADVTVMSEFTALQMGFDVVTDTPDFTIAIVGSGGVTEEVPGFFLDEFTITALGGSVTATNVPIIVLNVTNPADPGNIVSGIVGTNMLAGRNVVIDPDPSLGGGNLGPQLFISDPITNTKNWNTNLASAQWSNASHWSSTGVPNNLSLTKVTNLGAGDQVIEMSSDQTIWDLTISATNGEATVHIQQGVTLTTFSGIVLEQGGGLWLSDSNVDTQFIEILGGSIYGQGRIDTGNGPIDGQVENRIGTISPGEGFGYLEIRGRFANGPDGVIEIDVGGLAPSTQYDELVIEGTAPLDGTLRVNIAHIGEPDFQTGDTFEFLYATDGIGGEFDALEVSEGGYSWLVDYTSDSVILTVSVPGDFNSDGTVDASDYVVWRNNLGSTTALLVDVSGNNVVDMEDYNIWKANFGNSLPGFLALSPSNVPEPATWAMLSMAAAGWWGFLRRRS